MKIGRASFFFSALALVGAGPVFAQSGAGREMEWKLDLKSDIGIHIEEPHDLAINRHQLEFEQIWRPKKTPWTLRAGGRARVEGAYANNTERYGQLAEEDGQDLEFREISAQYRSGPFSAKFGSQTVVWGEAFGAFYADIVNPKDLREGGIGDLAEVRRPVEMVNLQYISSKWSVQALYLPVFRPNLIPKLNSDFFPSRLEQEMVGGEINLKTDPVLEEAEGDSGGRLQMRLGASDLSVFFMSMIDRQPAFGVNVAGTPGSPVYSIRTLHSRVNVSGLTLSWANDDVVLRAETTLYADRNVNIAPTAQDIATGNLSRLEKAKQWIGVLGLDGVVNERWTVGVQYSEDFIEGAKPQFRLERESLLGFQVAREWEKGARFRLQIGQVLQDGSYIIQPSFFVPRGRGLEIGLEGVYFGGGEDSNFGSVNKANRLVLAIRGFFRG